MNYFSKLRVLTVIALTIISLFAVEVSAQQNPRELFQRARMLEESNQNLGEAIKLYSQVISLANEQRALAAKAQLRMGLLYDRLRRKAEAQRAYQAVVSRYGDQADVARQAQAKIVASATAKPTGKENMAKGKAATTVMVRQMMVRQIWSGDEVDSMGSPSPDGRYLSFVDWTTGDLAVRDLAAGKNRRLTNKGSWAQSDEYAEFSRVSPDGGQIAYAWFNDKFYELRVIAFDGSNVRVLYRNPELRYVQPSAWFPDGKTLVGVFSRPDRSNQIVLISVADGSVRTLKTLDWRYPQRLSLSPDGRWIAYDFSPLEDSSKRDIYLLATDGSREVRLVEHPSHDYLLGWSPDGERIVFASDRTGTISVWSLRVVSGKSQGTPEMIKHDAGQIYPLGLTRNGSLYYSMGETRDVYIGEFDAVAGKILSPKNATDRYVGGNSLPDWSADGEHLAYLSRRSLSQAGIGSRVIVIQSVKTGEERLLAPKLNLPTNHRGGPRWSPDGRFLLVVGRDEKGRLGIYRINVQTQEVSAVEQSQPRLELPEWTSDGKAIYCRGGIGDDDNTYLVVRDLETARERILHRSRHIHAVAVSPDGRQLAFSTEHPARSSKVAMSNVLMIMPTTGDQPQEILRLPETEEITAIAWMADGQHLLFSQTKNGEGSNKQVWRIPIARGKAEPTQLNLDARQLTGLSFHPDGRRVTFTDFSRSSAEILVMENFLPKPKAALRARSR